MKILFVIGGALRIYGGAVTSTLAFARKLERDFGHRCRLLTRHPTPRDEIVEGIPVAAFRDAEELKEAVKRFRPDVMVGALADATDALRAATRYRIPCALYLHGYEFCPPTPAEREAWRIPPESVFPSESEADFVLGAADAVFACSRHLKSFFEERRQRTAEAIYGDFDREEVLLARGRPPSADCITGICGFRHKGIETFLRLAGAFPRETFLLAGALGSDIDLSYHRRMAELPNLTLPGRLSTKEILGRSKIVLAPSLLPEPFGRIAVEAMANGIPVLASSTGGLAEILGAAPMAVEAYRDVEVWIARLDHLIRSADLRALYGREGRALAQPFLEGNSTAVLESRLQILADERSPDFDGRRVVAFYGDDDRAESDSLVNLRWSEALAAKRAFVPCFRAAKFDLPDFTVHHDYTRHFTDFVPPDSGACIAVRTSDFGPYPPAWAAKVNAEFDQLWVHTEWIKTQALASGIDPARVRVVPLGVDPAIFRPDGPMFPLPTEKSFRFLFVGTAVVRKGFDILLQAYRETFSRDDDVSLIVKDHSANAFHSATYREEIDSLMRDEKAAEIIYLDEFLPVDTLASMYRACDVAVFPYRAEGFCLPILEAMACGTPSIVPDRGACVDFCSEKTSFMIPAIRIKLPVNRRFALKIGVEEDIAAVDFCEVRVETLARALGEVANLPEEELKLRAAEGVRVARRRFTWERSAERAALCLKELEERLPIRLQNSRRKAEQAHNRFEAARRLFVEHISRRVPAAGVTAASQPSLKP